MGLWRYALRELLRHPGRSIFTLTGIAVGVAAAVASFVAAQTARGHYRALFDGVSDRVTLEVHAPGEAGFDPAISKSLEEIPGVVAAIPEVCGIGGMPSWYCSVPVVVRGQSRTEDEAVPRPDEVFVPAPFAEAHGMKRGGRLRLWGKTGQADLTISTRPAKHIRFGANAGVTVSLSTAQQLFGLGEKVNLVRVILDDTANPNHARQSIAAAIPSGLAVREPAGRADVSGGLRAAAIEGLTGLTALALAGAGYIVFGLAQLNLIARRSELAILRTLGASTQQVRGILFRHAILLGIGGGGLGTGGGLLLAWGISASASASMGVTLASPRVGWPSILLGMGIGLGISLAALWLPARQMCQQSPLELFRAAPRPAASPSRRKWSTPCTTFVLAAGIWLLAEIACGTIPPQAGQPLFPLGLVLVLVGLAGVTGPQLMRLLPHLERPAKVICGIEGMLAVRQLGVRHERTARASGVVFVAVTMVVGFGHSVLNTLTDVRGWTDRAIPAHFLVRGGLPDPGFVLNVPLPESIGEDLRKMDGVASVEQISFLSTSVNDMPVLVLARTFPADRSLPLDLRHADSSVVRAGLANGEAILAESLAKALDVRDGDSISLATPTGAQRIRVAGVVTEYAAGGQALYLDWKTATSLFGPCAVHVFLVTGRVDQRKELDGELSRYCSARGLHLQRSQELRQVVDDLTRGLTGGLWALLMVIVAVAALGVTSTVAVNAQEQQQDARVLQAIGMSTRRIARAFRLQVIILILMSLPAAILCGILLAAGLDRAIRGLWGYSVPFQIQWTFLSESVGGTILAAILSGLVLKRRIGARSL